MPTTLKLGIIYDIGAPVVSLQSYYYSHAQKRIVKRNLKRKVMGESPNLSQESELKVWETLGHNPPAQW